MTQAAQEELLSLLGAVKDTLHLSVAFTTSLEADQQELTAVSPTESSQVRDRAFVGRRLPLSNSLCRAILAGELPPVIVDVPNHPVASTLGGLEGIEVTSFASVPITLSDGSIYGTLCACSVGEDPPLEPRNAQLLRLFAGAAALLLEPQLRTTQGRLATTKRHQALLDAGGPAVVLQPIVDLRDGAHTGFEALARFPAPWPENPQLVFHEAHEVGLGPELEIASVASAATLLDRIDGYLSLNASPDVVRSPQFRATMEQLPLDRILLELSEHDAVDDYDSLHREMQALREQGMRVAVDDVGSGFSSLRHVVALFPEVIKLDRSIVTGLSEDPVRQVLVTAMKDFAKGCGAQMIAEGVETAQDLQTLASLGVEYGQGFHLGRPAPLPAWA